MLDRHKGNGSNLRTHLLLKRCLTLTTPELYDPDKPRNYENIGYKKGSDKLALQMLNLPSSCIRHWWRFKVGQEFSLDKPPESKVSYPKQASRASRESEEDTCISSRVYSDSGTAQTGPSWTCWSLLWLQSLRDCLRFDVIYRAEIGKKTKPTKNKNNPNISQHITVWASPAAGGGNLERNPIPDFKHHECSPSNQAQIWMFPT